MDRERRYVPRPRSWITSKARSQRCIGQWLSSMKETWWSLLTSPLDPELIMLIREWDCRSPTGEHIQTTSQPAQDFWPTPLRHCAKPLVTPDDEYVTIVEVTSEPINGFRGNRLFYAALVPAGEVDSVLNTVGGIGHGVFTETRHQAFGPKGEYIPPFWIPGPNGKRFETLVPSGVTKSLPPVATLT